MVSVLRPAYSPSCALKNQCSRLLVLTLAFYLPHLVAPFGAAAQSTYFPARGMYNGFLEQTNIVECDNGETRDIAPKLEVFNQQGTRVASVAMQIRAKGSQHIILNDLASIKDSYGTYQISLSAEEALAGGKLSCRTAFYRSAAPGSDRLYDFAYVLPVRNPDTGSVSGSFNSFSPAGGVDPTYNWLSVVNLDYRAFSATVTLFDFNGDLLETRTVDNLAPGARIDLGLGHDQGQVVGSYRISPSIETAKYQAFLMRYGVERGEIQFAFPLRAVSGACARNPLQLSTMGSESTANWIEVLNLNSIQIPITVLIRDRNGLELSRRTQNLDPYAQMHVFANPVIDEAGTGNVGSAQILCTDPSDRVVVQSLYYGRKLTGSTLWAYASQELSEATVPPGSQLVAPINTFLGMANWLKLANHGAAGTTTYELNAADGELVAAGEQSLADRATADLGIHELFAADSVGSVRTRTTTGTRFNGELVRVLPKADGTIGTIMQVPGTVQRNGITGQSGTNSEPSTGFIGDPQSLKQYRNVLTYEEMNHLLLRAGFGADNQQILEDQGKGLAATVLRLMTMVPTPELDAAADRWLDGTADNVQGPITVTGTERWWMHHMLHTPNPLKERMALIWHDIFASGCARFTDIRLANMCHKHALLLRSHALGNFRSLAQSMTTDYMMLRFLNGNTNVKGRPDENYAREFWELFSLGEPSKHTGRYRLYDSADLLESSRAFTGWTTPFPAVQDPNLSSRFVPSRFDNGEKTIWKGTPYEATGRFGNTELVNLTLDRPEAAQWIAKRLFAAFVHDNPSPAVVNELADLLRSSNWNVRPAVRKILLSEALFSTTARKTRVKDAATFGVGLVRSLKLPIATATFSNSYQNDRLGLEPLAPPSVNGWPISKYKGAKLSEYFLGWSVQYVNLVRSTLRSAELQGNNFTYSALLPKPNATAAELVDHLAKLLDVRLNGAERNRIISYVNTQRSSTGVRSNVPFQADNPLHVRQKVTGVIWLLAQHEDYMTY